MTSTHQPPTLPLTSADNSFRTGVAVALFAHVSSCREEAPTRASLALRHSIAGEPMDAAPEGVARGEERNDQKGSVPATEKGRKQIYLRTVYPLNPGIPHFVDVPGGW